MCARTARIGALVAALAALGTAPAAAQESAAARSRAASLQSEGLKLLLERDAGGALRKFEAAYALVPSPKILFNMGRAYQELGRHVEAYDCFDRFLTEATNVPSESRAQAEQGRAALRARVALVEIVAPAGADLSVDGRPVGRTPLPRPLVLAPGTRVFRLERDGRLLSERAVPVAASAVTRFVIDAAPAAPTPREVPLVAGRPAADASTARPPAITLAPRRNAEAVSKEDSVLGKWWFWAAVGVVAAAAVTGGLAATGALGRRDAGCPPEWTACP